MMRGQWYIDGADAAEFNAYLTKGSYADLVCLNPMKTVAYNDWQEQDGIDPDLSAPVLDARSVTLRCAIAGADAESDYGRLVRHLASNGACHTFGFAQIGLETALRLTGCGDTDTLGGLKTFTLTFSEDAPLAGYTYSAPSSGLAPRGDCLIDGTDAASFGIRILKGTRDSLTAAPDPKQGLTRSISVSAGVEHDGGEGEMKLKSRTATLRCLMQARTSEEFWSNRNALLHTLSQPGARTLTGSCAGGRELPFYYKSCSAQDFSIGGGVSCKLMIDIELYTGGLA